MSPLDQQCLHVWVQTAQQTRLLLVRQFLFVISQVGADGTQSGWFSDDGAALAQVVNPFAIDWRTTDFLPGDVLVLGMLPAVIYAAYKAKQSLVQ